MKEIAEFEIELKKRSSVFHPGQTIIGTVKLQLTEPMAMKDIELRIYGRERTRISRPSDQTSKIDVQSILDQKIILWSNDKDESENVPSGAYKYNFKYRLPSGTDMPTSVDGQMHFNIRYLQKPPSKQNEKAISCLCFPRGIIQLTANIDRYGYCPGESIVINAECSNLTDTKMHGIRAKIVRTIVRKCTDETFTEVDSPGGIQTPTEIDERENFHLINQLFQIPAIPPTTTGKLISISYAVEISVLVPYRDNIHVNFPIQIVTSPMIKSVMSSDSSTSRTDSTEAQKCILNPLLTIA
ncbi:uncharacterized protein TRIADDRAFT_59953 [Trichoplax adhaerens]|uniref:Arrestin C-terminal-like domain-containing protein n=1 Tax=Trichoplax adhaerens TaxID=10228 RepID=B3S6W4_TRIAD|nr:hypothetical protein TRIADDRAFT_59953 [Trichoplax adhaerens]EDV21382.1 hypothetical protein TRIADDRAFT_59953 [Trichoplax adhaerens]|eukprot:XP_002115982.1 hypothetical protein TRIADDRAFT_59953 [Trichoplax adhaerens]